MEFYFEGEQQTLGTAGGGPRLTANTWTGRTEPKFGAYRGETVAIDTYVYQVQIGTELGDIVEAAGLKGGSTPGASTGSAGSKTVSASASASAAATGTTATGSCSWEGHCVGRFKFLFPVLGSTLLTCVGASCETEDDCSDELVCTGGKCAST